VSSLKSLRASRKSSLSGQVTSPLRQVPSRVSSHCPLEWRRMICCITTRPLSTQWQSTHVLFGIQVSQQNSETNWRQYSGKQFGLSLAKNWILMFLPSYMTFQYLQTDAIDKWDSCLLACMIRHTVCTDCY